MGTGPLPAWDTILIVLAIYPNHVFPEVKGSGEYWLFGLYATSTTDGS